MRYTFTKYTSVPLANCILYFKLLKKIKMLTGVVEVGLFCGMAKAAYFGNAVRPYDSELEENKITNIVCQDGSVSVRWANGNTELLPGSQ